ncbi:hypothetical protein Rz [Burkholderia phage BcepNazgul]|uniref:Uncharacterized protein n=1 Tax=Burkholderia phage BcepNazgul TaxID=242861 RepID=Q6UYK4_9CAUD|nr:hypothetical protein Rz [Burkholderia phage BcepNazgul]AAQ63337.1 hypothetical protein Rz [Burkholderia phage BcepNazgul]
MNTIIAAIGAAIVAILGAFGYSRIVKAKASADVAAAKQGQAEAQRDAADARTQTAEVRDAHAQSNAAAAQQGVEAAKERSDVEQQVSGADGATFDGLVQKWASPESGSPDAAGTKDRS